MAYFLSIFFGTFILEDVALATSIAMMATHKLNFLEAFIPCFLGISVGDLGLYLLGYGIAKFGANGRFKFVTKYHQRLEKLSRSKTLHYSILISRMIPGTRTPTYLGAGFFRYPFWRFFLLTMGSVFTWVLIGLVGGDSLLYFLKDHWIPTLILLLPLLHLVKNFIITMLAPWDRKAFRHAWKKYLYFEFWPPLFFYLPIVPIYIFLSLKHRSFLLPFYANPNLKHGGLIGESKWDFLKHLKTTDPSTLRSLKLASNITFTEALAQTATLGFPLILKPDVGQRGFGVRVIRNESDLREYLAVSQSELIAQTLSTLPQEAGIFYIRKPSEEMGRLFSITDKKFPSVTGDGMTPLGDLILRDRRARMIAGTYFTRFQGGLGQVLGKGQCQPLVECGNHCQGAIFLNGKDLMSDRLSLAIDRIAKQIPDFYFGRFDIRYESAESLRQGKNFEIVEVNGAGSEATHIWDARTSLTEAYKTLFIQWSFLFAIGDEVKHQPNRHTQVHVASFLKECYRVFFRKDPLSISS